MHQTWTSVGFEFLPSCTQLTSFSFSFFFYFLNYESVITHMQETWEIQNEVTYSSLYFTIIFKYENKFLVEVLISNSQKLIKKYIGT